MALLGQAALAMWWDMAGDMQAEFAHWHTHEHFVERLAIPGFLRASRWTDAAGGEGVFVMYELRDHAVLASDAYLARLNAPSPWSTRLMPHHRHMVRCQCHVLASAGGVAARHALTLRFVAQPGDAWREGLAALLPDLAGQPGVLGAHLLQHQAPAIEMTTEQKIRGGDAVADAILVLTGYDLAALQALVDAQLRGSPLLQGDVRVDAFQLSVSEVGSSGA
jgi:hypothetical protein